MGLTVHFQLAAPVGVNAAGANEIVASLRRTAIKFWHEGFVDDVLPVTSDPKTLRRFACDWLTLPVPGTENTSTGVEILPAAGFLFCVNIGMDCEPLWLGLCHYPPMVFSQGKEYRIKKRAAWRLFGFSKTQFASRHGWGHFQRCHCAVVNLLAACRAPGLRVKISDEGEYWPRRSLARLRENLEQMNGLVAAAAGALKDAAGTEAGSVKSPIFAYKNFERLEAMGAPRLAPALAKLRELLRRP